MDRLPDQIAFLQPQITLVAWRAEGRLGYWQYAVPLEEEEPPADEETKGASD